MATEGKIVFNNEDAFSKEFLNALNKKVNKYFKENGISKYGNTQLYIKTVFMLSLFILPFVVIITLQPAPWIALILCMLMGSGMAGIGLSIMHDAIHGAYSSNQAVNKFWGYTLNLVGGNAINWRIQHNIKHHTYPNVDDHDEDIAPKAGLRFSPNSKKTAMHKYQYIYGWFVYSLGSLFWVTFKDFVKITTYHKEGLLEKNSKSIFIEYAILIFTKVFYFSYIIGLPVLFTSYSGGQIAIGFVALHIVSGLVLAVIFQPAHLMEEVKYPAPNDGGQLQYSWAIHQLYTTINFGNSNRFLNWFAGGLNFQIEHHLYPNVCHVHYSKIAPIVEETAKEFKLPYHTKPTFIGALAAHTHQLKLLGTA